MVLVLSLIFIAAIITPLIFKLTEEYGGKLISSIPIFSFIYLLFAYFKVNSGYIFSFSYDWVPIVNVNFAFFIDGLSYTFLLIITFVGISVFVFASEYMKQYKYQDRFYIYLLIFMASMLGLVSSDNIILMFIFWELTSISSYLLIGFKHDKEESRYSALQALIITGGGGLALLAGLVLLVIITGKYNISEIVQMGDLIQSHSLFIPSMLLLLLGAFTKSAQFPFHFWLPNAMAAPTPVSAFLHSATMVKAGVYLIARFNPAFAGSELWQNILIVFGAVTMTISALLAYKQTDLKKLLAYTTVNVLATLVFLIGLGTDKAIKAFGIYLVAHSLYKGSLFIVAGILDHTAGTRDVLKISGLRKYLPLASIAGIFAALSMMGFIPMLGFIAKETLYEATLKHSELSTLMFFIAFISGVFTVVVAILTGIKPFFGKPILSEKSAHKIPFTMWFAPMLLAVTSLVFGLLPGAFFNDLMNQLYSSISELDYYKIKLWHGFNIIFALSLVTIIIGYLLYKLKLKKSELISKFTTPKAINPSYYYDGFVNGLLDVAKLQTKVIQNGYLRSYITIILLFTIGVSYYAFFRFSDPLPTDIEVNISIYELLIIILVAAASLITAFMSKRLSAVASLGAAGSGIAVIFLYYSAPDLAMTQFAIETLTVILFVLILYKLPKFREYSNTPQRIRDIFISIAMGTMMTLVIVSVSATQISDEFKKYFSETSYIVAKGKNIVNVILVDYRALDTLGEITVLAIAAIGVYSLLKLKLEEGDNK